MSLYLCQTVGLTLSLSLNSDILVFPLTPSVNLVAAALGDLVVVGPLVAFALLNQSFLDQFVEVRVEPAVVDPAFVVVVKFVLDRESFRLVLPCNHVQYVALEASQVVHVPMLVIQTLKYIDVKIRSSAVEPDSEIARLDSLAAIVAGSPCRIREQVRDFAIERVIEIRRDVLICELFFDCRIDDEIRHATCIPGYSYL